MKNKVITTEILLVLLIIVTILIEITFNNMYNKLFINNIHTTKLREDNNIINEIIDPCEYDNIIQKTIDVNNLEESNPIEETYEILYPIEPEYQIKLEDPDIYLLAKIVMCEAEGESYECKKYIAQTIINRVKSNDFPNTIYDVIFEKNQFTPTFDGRWEIVNPNEECYNAVYDVIYSENALIDSYWFESCSKETWHSKNLKLLIQLDKTKFYTYK